MTARWSCALIVGALLVGCSLDKSGAGSDISLVTDTALVEDSPSDDVSFDVERDTFDIDTGWPMDGGADIADAANADTADGASDASETGAELKMTCVEVAAGTDVNLTSEGIFGWAHYGLSDVKAFDHKASLDSISDVTITGGPAARYAMFETSVSWSDGTPTATASKSSTGIYMNASGTFSFDVQGDGTLHTARVYVRSYVGSSGSITVTLGAASQKTPIPPAPTTKTFGCDLAAAWSSKLHVTVTKEGGLGVALLSVTLF